ncbi:MAG: RNA polymerase sigma factor [Gemmatimonadota bacterium]
MDRAGLYHVNDGDALLVARVLGGDDDAYGILMARYRDRFGRYALHLLRDQGDAEDVLQETFVRGFRYLRHCENPGRFGAWLFRILVNRCRTAYRERERSSRTLVTAEHGPEAITRDGPAGSGWREEIDRALGHLPGEQREAFLLKYVEDLSYDEMEQLTGAGISALKMRVSRACKHLRDLLLEVYDGKL